MKNIPSKSDALVEPNGTFLDSVSFDCVVLGFTEGQLKVLLTKFNVNDKWMLPGGFVLIDEDVDCAANRALKVRLGVEDVYLRQFHTFSNCGRVQKSENIKMLEVWGLTPEEEHWYLKRFISIGYYALVEYQKVNVTVDEIEEEVGWFNIYELPPLYADHKKIIEKAIATIRKQIGIVPIGYELLPEKFTMPELRLIYEALLGHELDRRNFQRKMLSIGLINRLREKRKIGAHKAPYLYSYNKEKLEEAKENDLFLMTWAH